MSDSSSVMSDDTSEQEIFDHSLSMWREKRTSIGVDDFNFDIEDEFEPLELDLHTQCGIGLYESVLSAVKSQCVDLDKKNKGGWTPLMYGCYTGHEAIVNLLIEAGVDLNSTNHKVITPLMLASSCGNEGIVRILLEQGAHIDAVDYQGWTALFHATFSGQQIIVKYLLDCHADVSISEKNHGMTPFMEAAQAGHENIVQYFLNKGVDTKQKNKRGSTVLTFAMLRGHSRIVSAIQEFNRKKDVQRTKVPDSPRSILKQSSALLEGPEAVKKMMKKLAFKDEENIARTENEEKSKRITPTLIPPKTSMQLITHHSTTTNTSHLNMFQNNSTTNTTNTYSTTTTLQTTTANQASTVTLAKPPTTTLQQLLLQLGLEKYAVIFQEQDVDLPIFLTLSDNHLREIGINLLGPRKKMLMAINRWHNLNNINNNNNNNNNLIINDKNNNNNLTFSSEKEIRDFISALDSKNHELDNQVKVERQLRMALESCLTKERSHYHDVALNASNLINKYQKNSDVLIKNLRETITSFLNRSGSEERDQLPQQYVPISHLIGRDLAYQMKEDVKISQSQEAISKMKKSCDDMELFIKSLLEDLTSNLLLPLSN